MNTTNNKLDLPNIELLPHKDYIFSNKSIIVTIFNYIIGHINNLHFKGKCVQSTSY